MPLSPAAKYCEIAWEQDYLYVDGYPAPPRTWLVGLAWEF